MKQGERGKTGDHGQDGDDGDRGKTGPMGPAYSSFVTRHIILAYLFPITLSVIAFALMGYGFDNVVDRIERVALSNCEAGNKRTVVQANQIRDNIRQNEILDLGRLLNLDEDRVKEIREISRRSSETRINQLPYIDCQTGNRIPLPPP